MRKEKGKKVQTFAISIGSRIAGSGFGLEIGRIARYWYCSKPDPSEEGRTDILRQTLLMANKIDAPGASSRFDILSEFFGQTFDILTISAATGEGAEDLRCRVFQDLNIIRVYTKVPGKKADLTSSPYVMKYGSTVMDAARTVHRGFVQSLKFAKVWSSGTPKHSLKYSGQMVERTHVLEDGDILELHI